MSCAWPCLIHLNTCLDHNIYHFPEKLTHIHTYITRETTKARPPPCPKKKKGGFQCKTPVERVEFYDMYKPPSSKNPTPTNMQPFSLSLPLFKGEKEKGRKGRDVYNAVPVDVTLEKSPNQALEICLRSVPASRERPFSHPRFFFIAGLDSLGVAKGFPFPFIVIVQ